MSDEKPPQGSLFSLLHEGAPQPAPVIKKTIGAAIVSRKFTSAPKIPENYMTIATSFLMTPDMTGSDNSAVHPEGTSDQFQDNTINEIRCICQMPHGSTTTVQCDSCKKWLHLDCIRLKNPHETDTFICIYCQYEIAQAIKTFIRRRFSVLPALSQRLENEIQSGRATHAAKIWQELNDIVSDIQEVMKMIPESLHSQDD